MLFVLLCGLVHAEEEEASGLRLGLAPGIFFADSNEYINSTWTLVPRVGYRFNNRWAAELDLGFGQGLSDLDRMFWIFTPRVNAVLHGPVWGPLQPFVAAGPGLLRQKENRSDEIAAEQTNEAGYGLFENPDTDFLFNIGPGLLLRPGDGPLSLRTDFRYLANIGSEPHGAKASDIYHDFEWTIGLMVELGERPEPEPSDRDLDGLIDDIDECPDEPEDFDGFQDSDGCPDDDNDRDGIVDRADDCPDDAEDRDGFEDGDGCPDNDNDRDGIADRADECPDEPETPNSYQDEDGCPDEVPEEVKRFTGIIQGITFETNSDVIRSSSEATLRSALAVLSEFEDVRLEVQGHTDNVGSDDFNLDLSQRRAESVVTWFAASGISSSRLVPKGYGETSPIADNGTSAGQSENRRVEFKLIQ
ncbi:MAG: outer membrane protein OmpA-like peptidoglycan-associated protein [Myxococcota bacterium]|jgi:outer membrane protein OmpA-like peptidoglycan-associated protein